MRLPSIINNDQNIGRVLPKMNDDFRHESNEKLQDCVDSITYFSETNQNSSNFAITETQNCSYNRIYSGCAENGEVSSSDANCQTAESEVKSLKEWLILHNDLIQQQNDEILDKERQIFLLQKENEMLKERLSCLEKGIPFDPEKHFTEPIKSKAEDFFPEDMTQDSCGQYEEESKENIELLNTRQSDNVVTCSLEVTNYELNHASDFESQVDTTIDEEHFVVENDLKSEDYIGNDFSDSFKTESDTAECNKDSLSEYNFTVNNFCEFDPMKNIKMSIRRKRVSSSSVLSNNEPVLLGEKKTLRRIKKKRRRSAKDSQILTSKDPYYVTSGSEEIPALIIEPEIENISGNTTLEVPRWRVKHYSSCYTMEGTENLDDEVYNKRHMRLEIDERRRKRWDVQRIREQRVIEKLKQRQERIASGSKGDSYQDTLTSLWPKTEDIKFLEIGEELPVSAFGHPVPKMFMNDFGLPWLNNPAVLTRRSNAKRSAIGGRKRSKSRR